MALVRHNLLLTMNCKCVVPENIPTFSLEDSPTPLEIDHICTPGIRLENKYDLFQLSFIQFFKFFGLKSHPPLRKFQSLICGGSMDIFWICSVAKKITKA